MNVLQASEIRLHLCNGRKHTYYQGGLSLAPCITDDSDKEIFRRAGLIHNGERLITDYSGEDVYGITVLAQWPYASFFERERLLGIVVTEIGQQGVSQCNTGSEVGARVLGRLNDRRLKIYTEIEFRTGMKLFLEFTQIAEAGISEEMVLHHIFSHSSLCCRRYGGGLSIWNTEHIVSWANYPQLIVCSEHGDSMEVSESIRACIPVLRVF